MLTEFWAGKRENNYHQFKLIFMLCTSPRLWSLIFNLRRPLFLFFFWVSLFRLKVIQPNLSIFWATNWLHFWPTMEVAIWEVVKKTEGGYFVCCGAVCLVFIESVRRKWEVNLHLNPMGWTSKLDTGSPECGIKKQTILMSIVSDGYSIYIYIYLLKDQPFWS